VSENFDDETPDYSPDGTQLAFASTRSGSEEIWVANADGSNPVQMTTMGGPVCSGPRWSPDGRKILFHSSSRQSARALYLLEMQSGRTHQLTDQRTWDSQASWSHSGRFIYFESNRAGRTGRREIWRMSADGGNPTQVTTQGGSMPIESPDGLFLYYAKVAPPLPTAIWRVPVGGGEERFIVEGLSNTLNFAVAKEGLYFLAVGDAQNKTSIDLFEFKTGKRSTLLKLDKFWWYGMALSPDQQSLLYSVVDSAGSNLMLVDKVR
jgi:dipeptidyl aminopeptidase/acylaminoacyl peptidase